LRQIAVAIVSGANPIPCAIGDHAPGAAADVKNHAASGRGKTTPRAGTFARTGLLGRTAIRYDAYCGNALTVRMKRRALVIGRPIEKARDRFPGAGF
jgi:hypothetical protein